MMIHALTNSSTMETPTPPTGGNQPQKYDILIKLFASIANDPWLLAMAVLFNLIAIVGMKLVAAPFRTEFPTITILDARVSGYTYAEFNAFYDKLDVQGCTLYQDLCQWDIYPFMIAYVITLSVGLLKSAEWNARDVRMTYMALVMGLADLIETLIQRHGCVVLMQSANVVRERVPEWLVEIASAAVQVKWILLSLSLGSIVAGTVRALQTGRVSIPYFKKKTA